jgi:hypothetical protein
MGDETTRPEIKLEKEGADRPRMRRPGNIGTRAEPNVERRSEAKRGKTRQDKVATADFSSKKKRCGNSMLRC